MDAGEGVVLTLLTWPLVWQGPQGDRGTNRQGLPGARREGFGGFTPGPPAGSQPEVVPVLS